MQCESFTRDFLLGTPNVINLTTGETLMVAFVRKGPLRGSKVMCLERGADPEALDKNGFAALHYAARHFLSHILKLFLKSESHIGMTSFDCRFNTHAHQAIAHRNGCTHKSDKDKIEMILVMLKVSACLFIKYSESLTRRVNY